MDPNQVVEALESGRWSRRLAEERIVRGSSERYFSRVLELFGQDPSRSSALAKHWRRVLSVGDDDALAYRAKGLGEWIEGDWLRAAASFQEAGKRQSDASGSYAIPAVDALARAGKTEQAITLGKSLVRKLAGFAEQQARARINLANAFEQADRLQEARSQYLLAIPALSETTYKIDSAKARLGLSSCELYLGQIKLAEQHAFSARETFLELDQQSFVDACDVNNALVLLLQGHADDALDFLIPIRERSAKSQHPRIQELIGDTYLHLNLWQEALDSYSDAALQYGVANSNAGNCALGAGQALYGLGRRKEAVRQLHRAKRVFRRAGNARMAAFVELVEAEQALATGKMKTSLHAGRIRLSFQRLNWKSAAVRAELVELESRIQQGENVQTRVAGLVRREIVQSDPSLRWRGEFLAALAGAERERLPRFRRMLESILEARLLVRSVSSRASFLADKRYALEAFLKELLAPNRAELNEEAYTVVARTRSAALVDEILSAIPAISEEQRVELERLRQELSVLHESDLAVRRLRQGARPHHSLRSLARRWREITRTWGIEDRRALVEPRNEPGCTALLQMGDEIHALRTDGGKDRLNCTTSELTRLLSAFRFELLEPLVSPEADSRYCTELLEEIRERLLGEWWEEACGTISPEGILWGVPWQALSDLDTVEEEAVLRLIPLGEPWAHGPQLPESPKVLLWIGDDAKLPNVQREATLLREQFEDLTICTTREAAWKSMQEGSYDLLHVAAHASYSEENPMFSYIRFPDGDLYASEIGRCPLKVGMAVLMACETGRLSSRYQQEPDGLVRAFLARSAEAVVATAWQLDDEGGFRLTSSLYYGLANGLGIVPALRQARRLLFRWNSHPFYWAAPVLFGGYSPAPEVGIEEEQD